MLSKKELAEYREDAGVLYHYGRIQSLVDTVERDIDLGVFYDAHDISFIQPVLPFGSPVTFEFANHFHWKSVPHRGTELTVGMALSVFHVTNAAYLFGVIRRDCRRCRYLLKKYLKVQMAQVPSLKWTIAPPFYATLLDIIGPFVAHHDYNKRQTVKIWIAIFVCASTSAVSMRIMQNYDTASVIQATIRHAVLRGWPSLLLIDSGSQLVKAGTAEVNILDLHTYFSRRADTVVMKSPATAHHHRGQVESAIRRVRDYLAAVQLLKLKQSILEWETTVCVVSNELNNLPIARNSNKDRSSSERTQMDFITPNRCMHGRNNRKALTGTVYVPAMPTAYLEQNQEITRTCLRVLRDFVHRFIPRSKWKTGTDTVNTGDVVLFVHSEGVTGSSADHVYKIGEVTRRYGESGAYRVDLRYFNSSRANEEKTDRSIRDVVVIHRLDEIEFNTPDYWSAVAAQQKAGFFSK